MMGLLFSFTAISQTTEIVNSKSPIPVEVNSKSITKSEEVIPDNVKKEAATTIFIRQSLNKIFISQLKNDGILTASDKKLKMQLTDNAMVVNGKLMSEALTSKYTDLYLSMMRKERCVGCSVYYEIDADVNPQDENNGN